MLRQRILFLLFIGLLMIGAFGSTAPRALADANCSTIKNLSDTSGEVTTTGNTFCFRVYIPKGEPLLKVTLQASKGDFDLYLAQGFNTSALSDAEHKLSLFEPISKKATFAFNNPSMGYYIIAVAPRTSGSSSFNLTVGEVEESNAEDYRSECSGEVCTAIMPMTIAGVQIGSDFGDRVTFPFEMACPGEIRAEAWWSGTAENLALILNGQGQVGYYAREDGQSPLVVSYTTTQADIEKSKRWQVSLVNFGGGEAVGGNVNITYPNCVYTIAPGMLTELLTSDNVVRLLQIQSPSDWEDLKGILISDPDCVSWGPNRIDCFVRGADSALWHKWWDGSQWNNWENLGGVLTSGPTAASWSENRLDVFVRGADSALWHKWWNGSQWSNWENLKGMLISDPDCVSWGPNRIDCFVRGTNSALWHKWWDGSQWSNWENLGGVLTSGPTAASWSENRLDVFVRGTNNALWHKWWDGSQWSDWEDLGGVLTSDPDCVSWGSDRIDCFVRGIDSALWHKWWDGSQWSGWENRGGQLISGPTASSWSANRLDIFVAGINSALWHMTWFPPILDLTDLTVISPLDQPLAVGVLTLDQGLTAPNQLSPANGTIFNHFPRTTTLQWSAVPDAAKYIVQVDCFHCCQSGKWCTEAGRPEYGRQEVTTTEYTFKFVGAQPGRWRVWAIGTDGQEGPKSDWREFRYTQ